jgi:hypothetical protein
MALFDDFRNVRCLFLFLGLVAYILWVVILVYCVVVGDNYNYDDNHLNIVPRPLAIYVWSLGQWCCYFSPRLSSIMTHAAWRSLECKQSFIQGEQHQPVPVLEIPTLFVQDFIGGSKNIKNNPLRYLENTYGKDWRERPLLLKGLWDATMLLHSDDTTTTTTTNTIDRRNRQQRRLSLHGLLEMNLTIPYFTDARVYGALKPDASAPVRDVVQRMLEGHPHKIGSQFIVQADPTLLEEVAPQSFVEELFGDYFSIERLLGHGNTFGIFPGLTTVPVFVANGNPSAAPAATATTDNVKGSHVHLEESSCEQDSNNKSSNKNSESINIESCPAAPSSHNFVDRQETPLTGLHCEPIANVAVQLSGFRKWTLVDPQHTWLLRPAISSDKRSFFPSWVSSLDHVPRYEVITYPGDAIFVPTWTWHRVDYLKGSNDLSIGASIFHFRMLDYVRRNPLFAVLMIPALIGELAGISSQ